MRAKKKPRYRSKKDRPRPRPNQVRRTGHFLGGTAVIISGGEARRPMTAVKKRGKH